MPLKLAPWLVFFKESSLTRLVIMKDTAVAILLSILELTFFQSNDAQVAWVHTYHLGRLIVDIYHVANGSVGVSDDPGNACDARSNISEKYLLGSDHCVALLSRA